MEYTVWDDREIPAKILTNGQPRDISKCTVTLVIDADWERIEETNEPEDHTDPENGVSIFYIKRDETEEVTPWDYKLFFKVYDNDTDKMTTTKRKPFTALEW